MKAIICKVTMILLLIVGCSNKNKEKTQEVNGPVDSVKTENREPLEIPWDSIGVDSSEVETYLSEDGNFRTCSWDTHMGGLSPAYASVCIFRTKEGKTKMDYMADSEMRLLDVHNIVRDDGLTYYIIRASGKASASIGYMGMRGYVIDRDSLRRVGVLKCEEVDKDIDMTEYGIPNLYFITNGHAFDWIWNYDSSTRTLYVPVIDEYGTIIDHYYVYRFDGMRFLKNGVLPHKGLYQALREYKNLEFYCETKKYIVRVDRLSNGNIRYASWKKPATMSDKPDLIVYDGKILKIDDDISEYIFENDGIKYIAGYYESKDSPDGISEYHQYLLVKKGAKILLKQELE